ncbi:MULTISPECIES: TetR/AcrR family transcriptional regulator [Variovorax]|jgi:AcrR family transcriptional regulator|uniref:TetR/AcrR family transcriptional regulator n=1 Tax=Variovorax TaxID=34072 RepID=UPI00086EA7E4|nr:MULTISPECIES: TetR/AcrR family transcriptional regulator [Variovorax]MBN8758661.1 TetR/AcrR family transcriptional regulator [Variovorax sp.]ODU14219.1 MAG: TetR family transcriptional regulator [Variovorax sp. SCN 67-85]ODV25628.1 MAG: TetR family transcriptional regulator [Variovorax sp. SCN 67-20]OJZ08731.1 MAG: TetR family transcriptional regulator [Variovorax sp. 67-131]UKI11117.1 TetR/AcrR family transcriptional regulator [Variovorax paradoxus]
MATNRERTESTQLALLEAARALFVSKGYGDTSTPEIALAAGITRGALYHHFADKRDLFRQVLAREAMAVAADIEAATPERLGPREALLEGSEAYLNAMTVPGRTRLLLVDGPAVLGMAEIMAIDDANAAHSLRQGLARAGMGRGEVSVDALSQLLSAAFDRAALEIDAGADAKEVRAAMRWLVEQALGPEKKR